MQKSVEKQALALYLQSVESQRFYALRKGCGKDCGKDAERMRKGCGKTCGIKQIVENQALREILSAFPHMRKDTTPNPPFRPAPPVGTIFALKNPIFSIHLRLTVICVIKCRKSLKIKGLSFSASLSACFPHPFRKLALLLKTYDNKAPPHPTPCPAPP
jgi:hypothetical protein